MTTSLLRAACGLALILVLPGCASTPEPEIAKPQPELIKLQHADCTEVMATLRQLSKSSEPEPGPKLVVVAHQATNSLLLSGQRKQIVEALDLIAQLDQPIKR